MGRALAGFILGALLVLAAIGFAMYYGLIPRGIQIVSTATGSGGAASSVDSSSGSATYTGAGNSTASDFVGAAAGYVFDKIGSYIAGSKAVVSGFFAWLLGSSLADAIANLIVLVVVAGIIYWLMRFFKWIIMTVVAIDALLIVLKYILMVI